MDKTYESALKQLAAQADTKAGLLRGVFREKLHHLAAVNGKDIMQ